MKTAIEITVYDHDIVPTDQPARIAWLNKYGPAPAMTKLTVEHDLSAFARLGLEINVKGQFLELDDVPALLRQRLVAASASVARETGAPPAPPTEPLLTQCFDSVFASLQKRQEERDRESALRAERAAATATERRERLRAHLAALTPADVLPERSLTATDVDRLSRERFTGWLHNATDIRIEPGEVEELLGAAALDDLMSRTIALHHDRAKRYAALVRKALNDEQWERYDAGYLPTEERDDHIRDYLFGQVTLSRYQLMRTRDLVHDDDCNEAACDVTFHASTINHPELTAAEYQRLKQLQQELRASPQLSDATITTEYRQHRSSCRCTGPSHFRDGLRVTVAIAGHTYRREYSLTD